MKRRDFLRHVVFAGAAVAVGKASAEDSQTTSQNGAGRAGDAPVQKRSFPALAAIPFALEDVRIVDPELSRMRDQDRDYMLALDPDRLLHNFRVNAKLPSTAKPLGNRESPTNGWRGHYVGHFLSASGQMFASTADLRIKAKADAIVAELAKCQAALGDNGYLSAFPENDFDDLENGHPGVAVLWYAIHKIIAGLLDAYGHCHNQQALAVLQRMAA